ncbi:hypothetical protein B0H15DRAFT_956758 [Mycena belliarum]|uniref:Uncharacterized protein n=1 Tax=Mycena belliarum TaxID=1033014 RepID=A0AAD6TNK8_9AGAR|nr:hypothetical protein B0H15DRAFT_956758 [Mycena belliae]
MICPPPFFPNSKNYEDDDEHDENNHKFWYVILGRGLFTLKSDADLLADEDEILIFFTRSQAVRTWTAYCRKEHLNGRHTIKPPPAGRGQSAPAFRASSRQPFRSVSKSPAVSRAIKKEVRSKAMPKKEEDSDEHYLPLYADDSPPLSPAPSRPLLPANETLPLSPTHEAVPLYSNKRPVGALGLGSVSAPFPPRRTRLRPSPSSPERARLTPPLAERAHSISISSESSLSASTADVQMASASRVGGRTRTPLHAPPQPATAPVKKHFKKSLAPSATARAKTVPQAQSPSARLLYNPSTRTFYEDAEMAVREMVKKDTVQVVECEDVAQFCAGLHGKTGR